MAKAPLFVLALAALAACSMVASGQGIPPGPPQPGPPAAGNCPLALTQLVNRTVAKDMIIQSYQNSDRTFNGTAPYPSVSLAKVTLAPCGVRVMHTHNGVDELLYVVNGSVSAYTVYPSGSVCEQRMLMPGQAFLYPRGLVHGAHNPSCTDYAEVLGFFTAFDSATVNIGAAAFNGPYGPFKDYVCTDLADSVSAAVDSTTLHYDARCLARCDLGGLGGQDPIY